MRSRGTTSVSAVALPIKQILHRFSLVLMLTLAIGLMVLQQVRPELVQTFRVHVTDTLAPVLSFVAAPIDTIGQAGQAVSEIAELRTENSRLKVQNERLLYWQQAALRLEAENAALRGMLNVADEPEPTFITARVLADPGGAFLRSVIITSGREEGVRPGQAVVSGNGLIGRVVEAGQSTARVLLITDMNARVPVMLETTRERAMLGGNNSGYPELLYLRPGEQAIDGEMIYTSGQAGLFPPGIPVGHMRYVPHMGRMIIQPTADLGKLEFIRVVKFGAEGGLTTEATNKDGMSSEGALPLVVEE